MIYNFPTLKSSKAYPSHVKATFWPQSRRFRFAYTDVAAHGRNRLSCGPETFLAELSKALCEMASHTSSPESDTLLSSSKPLCIQCTTAIFLIIPLLAWLLVTVRVADS